MESSWSPNRVLYCRFVRENTVCMLCISLVLLTTFTIIRKPVSFVYTMVKRVSRVRNILDYREGGNVLSNQVASSQESSETEFVEEEKPWPLSLSHQSRCKTLDRQVRRVEPRPQSHLFRRGSGEGKERRSRHSRRWENCTLNGGFHHRKLPIIALASFRTPSFLTPT